MIGKLRGIIDTIAEDYLILDVHGVGYRVFCSARTLSVLQNIVGEVSLLIETDVKEDHIHLYGFLSEEEKIWFTELCKVKGVGNKMALKIFGVLNVDDITIALSAGDSKAFARAQGVGSKLAIRIMTELKDSPSKLGGRIGCTIESSSTGSVIYNTGGSAGVAEPVGDSAKKKVMDAVSALENLGYARSNAYNLAAKKVSSNAEITLETLITECLREMSKL